MPRRITLAVPKFDRQSHSDSWKSCLGPKIPHHCPSRQRRRFSSAQSHQMGGMNASLASILTTHRDSFLRFCDGNVQGLHALNSLFPQFRFCFEKMLWNYNDEDLPPLACIYINTITPSAAVTRRKETLYRCIREWLATPGSFPSFLRRSEDRQDRVPPLGSATAYISAAQPNPRRQAKLDRRRMDDTARRGQ